jgi:hypothetical protein
MIYSSKDINLKILDYLIVNDKDKRLNSFILTNNKTNRFLYSGLPSLFHETKNEILNPFKELESIIENNQIIETYGNKEIETCFDINYFTRLSLEELCKKYIINSFWNKEKKDISNYKFNHIFKIYKSVNKRSCMKILNIIRFDIYSKKYREFKEDILNNNYISIKDFTYLLIKYTIELDFVIIVFNKKYKIFGCGRNNILKTSIFEIQTNGIITVPKYTINEIMKNPEIKRMNIYENMV